jgi:hypothetical protein
VKRNLAVFTCQFVVGAALLFSSNLKGQNVSPAVTQDEGEKTGTLQTQSDLAPAASGQPVNLPVGEQWMVRLLSLGGLTGRGRGYVSINSTGVLDSSLKGSFLLTPEKTAWIFQKVKAVQHSAWRRYGSGMCNDCFQTQLAFIRRGKNGRVVIHSALWDNTTKSRVPPEILQLDEDIMGLQKMVAKGRGN